MLIKSRHKCHSLCRQRCGRRVWGVKIQIKFRGVCFVFTVFSEKYHCWMAHTSVDLQEHSSHWRLHKISDMVTFNPVFRITPSPPSAPYMNWVSTGSGNGLAPNRRQANPLTNADLLSNGPLGIIFSENWIAILHSRKCSWKCHMRNGDHLVKGEMS